MSCVCACAYVWAGVCGCVWLRLIRSSWASLPWAISGPVTLSPLSDPCGVCSVWSVCGRRLRSVPVPRFLSPAASWTPIAGPWLPIASLRYPPQPYGKLRFCLRKAPRLPTEAPPLPYGSSASALRKAPFSSRCVLLLVINSLFRNWILPSSLWHGAAPPSSPSWPPQPPWRKRGKHCALTWEVSQEALVCHIQYIIVYISLQYIYIYIYICINIYLTFIVG